MKTTNHKTPLIAGMCALALSFGTPAYAEKGAETLVRLTKGAALAKVAAATVAAHKCASCKDTLATVVDKATKGPNHLIGKVSRHECAGCDTKIVTEGAGKAKKDLAMHSCNSEAKPLCCAKN